MLTLVVEEEWSVATSGRGYHHGDLRATLVSEALESLEAGESYSLRSVAKRAGVSPTAPYRHFADRRALDSAVAVEGFRGLRDDLAATLAAVPEGASAVDTLTDLGMAYIRFALQRQALFRLMFGNECDDADSDRVLAAQNLHDVLDGVLAQLFPGTASPGLGTATWALVHGLAFLHLDGKYRPGPPDEIAERVRSAIVAILTVGRRAD